MQDANEVSKYRVPINLLKFRTFATRVLEISVILVRIIFMDKHRHMI